MLPERIRPLQLLTINLIDSRSKDSKNGIYNAAFSSLRFQKAAVSKSVNLQYVMRFILSLA